jgi:hypothetical protein
MFTCACIRVNMTEYVCPRGVFVCVNGQPAVSGRSLNLELAPRPCACVRTRGVVTACVCVCMCMWRGVGLCASERVWERGDASACGVASLGPRCRSVRRWCRRGIGCARSTWIGTDELGVLRNFWLPVAVALLALMRLDGQYSDNCGLPVWPCRNLRGGVVCARALNASVPGSPLRRPWRVSARGRHCR